MTVSTRVVHEHARAEHEKRQRIEAIRHAAAVISGNLLRSREARQEGRTLAAELRRRAERLEKE